MAAMYSIGDFQGFVFTANPMFEIIPVPSISAKIVEISFSMEVLITAQVTTIGFGVPQVSGIGPIDNRVVQAEHLGPSSLLALASDWQTPPTAPTQFHRRISLLGAASNAGRGIFKFPQGLRVLPTQTYVVWCITSAAKGNFADVSLTVET
jgi:hypothetical protein